MIDLPEADNSGQLWQVFEGIGIVPLMPESHNDPFSLPRAPERPALPAMSAPAMVVGPRRAVWLSADGEIEHLDLLTPKHSIQYHPINLVRELWR